MRQTTSPEIRSLIALDRASTTPLHRQLYDGLRQVILEGLLRAGERVPATRQFALELEVSRLTVLTAYEQLLHEGYLEARVGSGTFVSASLPDDSLHAATPSRESREPRRTPLKPAPSAQPHDVASSYTSDGGGMIRPFRVGLPALDAFPQTVWSRLVARRSRTLSASHMAYGSPTGLRTLRSAIASHLRSARRVRCEEDDVIIVSGSQAALRLCASVLLPIGTHGAMEEPGYPGARVALTASGAHIHSVPIDDEGLIVTRLDVLGDSVRAAYVTPSHQYPLGMSMSATRRLALIEWARQRGTWIIEDDYDSEYRYVSRPLGALQGMESDADANGGDRRVIYIGTFSKVMFPALRVGYLVVPPALRERFLEAREASDLFPATLHQLALADFLAEGHFARHLRRMRGIYLGRRQAMLDGLAHHCAELLTLENADAGLHVTTRLPAARDDVGIVRALGARGILANPLSPCYAASGAQPGLLLGFGGSREPTLRRAIKTLAEVLRALEA